MDALFRIGRTASYSLLIASLFAALEASLSAATVTLAWTPSTDTNVVGYNVYYGTASGDYTNLVSTANTSTSVIPNLTEGTTYYFAATAYATDGSESPFSNEANYTVPITTVVISNSQPTLNAISDLTINQNATPQTVSLSGITSGSASENQTLTVTAVSSNPALIPAPTVNYTSANSTGSLSFSPASGATGTAVITVTVNDGQTQNNLVTRSFTVTVNAVVPVNTGPTLNPVGDIYIMQNAAAQTVNLTGINPGIIANTTKTGSKKTTLKISASAGNSQLISKPTVRYSVGSSGIMTFKPVRNATGTTTITLTLNNGIKSVQKSFKVTVLAVGLAAPATLTSAAKVNGQFSFNVAGSTGMKYIVQASTDLKNWIPVQTNTAPYIFTDTHSSEFSQRYYRTVSAP